MERLRSRRQTLLPGSWWRPWSRLVRASELKTCRWISRRILNCINPIQTPFNPTTTIPFDVKTDTRVVLEVYDIIGRLVMPLVDQQLAPGRYTIRFDARDLPSGTYFYRIMMADFQEMGKMVLVR